MNRQLIFVHGRAQHLKDADALKAAWIGAWEEGLAKSGLRVPIAKRDIRFPYYGKTLFGLVEGLPPDQIAEVIVRGPGADQQRREFVASVLEEVRLAAGITDAQVEQVAPGAAAERGPLNWSWVQKILVALDTHVPGGSGAGIAAATYDVYQYLKNPKVRQTIDTGVLAAVTPGVETVVVGHSLGSVVSYNLLKEVGDERGWQVPLHVTLGSPLGVTAIRDSLEPHRHPRCVSKWLNAMDERDVVALYPLDARRFDVDPPIENKTDVSNRTENRHGIRGYLDDEVVARRIHEALTAP